MFPEQQQDLPNSHGTLTRRKKKLLGQKNKTRESFLPFRSGENIGQYTVGGPRVHKIKVYFSRELAVVISRFFVPSHILISDVKLDLFPFESFKFFFNWINLSS